MTELPPSAPAADRAKCFLALVVPYVAIGLGNAFVVGQTFIDSSSGYNLHYWVANSINWAYNKPGFLFLESGPRAHWPFIPMVEIGALVQGLFGNGRMDFDLAATTGVGTLAATVLIAAWWGSRLAAIGGWKWPVLAIIALVAALQPGMLQIFAAHAYLVGLSVPVGMAVYLLATRQASPGADEIAAFPVLGFALSIHYGAAIPLFAIIAATAIAARGNDLYAVHRKLAAIPMSRRLLMGVIGLGGIFLVSLVVARLDAFAALIRILLDVRHGSISALGIVTASGIGVLSIVVGTVVILRKFALGRAMALIGGWSLVGWAVGANVNILRSWAEGVVRAVPGKRAPLALVDYVAPGQWGLVVPLLLAAGVWLSVSSMLKSRAKPADGFLGALLVVLILTLGCVVPHWDGADGSSDVILNLRYLAPVVAGIPVALLCAWKRSSKVRAAAVLSSTVVVVSAAWGAVATVRPVLADENGAYRGIDRVIALYRQANPDGMVLCVDVVGADCAKGLAWFWTKSFYYGNNRNPPLPATMPPRTRLWPGKGGRPPRASLEEALWPFSEPRPERFLLVVWRNGDNGWLEAIGDPVSAPPEATRRYFIHLIDFQKLSAGK